MRGERRIPRSPVELSDTALLRHPGDSLFICFRKWILASHLEKRMGSECCWHGACYPQPQSRNATLAPIAQHPPHRPSIGASTIRSANAPSTLLLVSRTPAVIEPVQSIGNSIGELHLEVCPDIETAVLMETGLRGASAPKLQREACPS
jgi:hypothetical protein